VLAARARRSRTNSRGEATREQLLESAVDLLRERGYAGLSIAAVCARADVAPTAVYWHFGSKAGLMEAVIARISGGHAERIRADAATAADPVERLDRLVAGIRALVTTQPLGSLTGVAIVGEGRHVTDELRAALRSARARELELIAGEFAGALGGERAVGETLAVLVLACTNYAALCYRIDHDAVEVDRILAGLRDAIVRLAGLAGAGPAAGTAGSPG
jgi:AcrR family transcriptional regulator